MAVVVQCFTPHFGKEHVLPLIVTWPVWLTFAFAVALKFITLFESSSKKDCNQVLCILLKFWLINNSLTKYHLLWLNTYWTMVPYIITWSQETRSCGTNIQSSRILLDSWRTGRLHCSPSRLKLVSLDRYMGSSPPLQVYRSPSLWPRFLCSCCILCKFPLYHQRQ